MTINPREYDPEELRSAAREELDERDVGDLRAKLQATASGEEGAVPDEQLKELLLMESGADPADLERPYLDRIPETYAARLTLFEWLEYVLERAGVRRTLEALEYYAAIGWIGESVADELRDHVRAFQEVAPSDGVRDLESPDHLVSLVYVARLTSMA
ncbi:MAG: FlaD/FlaE family flagellar protein [Halanaeroarchaeum sp.]